MLDAAPLQKRCPNRKYATPGDLEKLDGIWYQSSGTFNLTKSGRRLLQLFVTLVRLGYEGVDTPIGCISKTLWRIIGESRSDRTIFRALNDLEEKGFVVRKTFKVGDNRLKCIIRFRLDAFRFLSKKKEPTQTHINTQLTKSRDTDRTSIKSRVNSLNITDLNNKPRARARARKISRYHPIIVTLRILTFKMCQEKRLSWAKRRVALSAADVEINGCELYTQRSGVRWDELKPKWLEMSPEERDSIARTEIIPQLLRGDLMYIEEPPDDLEPPHSQVNGQQRPNGDKGDNA